MPQKLFLFSEVSFKEDSLGREAPVRFGYSCTPDCPVQTPNRASGLKWEKSGRKMDFGPPPPREKGEKWPKNGKIGGICPFFGHFSPLFPVGPKSIFRPFFPHFGWGEARLILGSAQGNRDRKVTVWGCNGSSGSGFRFRCLLE